MRTRMYGGVRGRKTKVGGKPTFVFLLLDYPSHLLMSHPGSAKTILGVFFASAWFIVTWWFVLHGGEGRINE